MRFEVPFLPDLAYIDFLNAHQDQIDAVHYSLDDPDVPDARYKLRLTDMDEMIRLLGRLEIPRKYLLLNSRFHRPGDYTNPEQIKIVVGKLEKLRAAGVLAGVVYSDAYFIQALSRAGGDTVAGLEAVPSVNCMIDNMDKVHAAVQFVEGTHFLRPGKIVLDRSLNRNPQTLDGIRSECRSHYPDMLLTLLVNEGCIYQCPFKLAHDAHIALANVGVPTDTHRINREVGCMPYFHAHPQRLFKSPFIRPEDVSKYEGRVDLLKICGRTMGTAFLQRTISAYCNQTYPGNLVELMDAMDWLADRIHVDNRGLPADFWETLTSCSKVCENCQICDQLFQAHGQRRKMSLKPFQRNEEP